jgi:hypothetical protein
MKAASGKLLSAGDEFQSALRMRALFFEELKVELLK